MTFWLGQLVRLKHPGSPFHGRLARIHGYWYWWPDAPPVVSIRFVPLKGEVATEIDCIEECLEAADILSEEDGL